MLMAGVKEEDVQKRLLAEITALETERNKINAAYVNTLGDNYVKSPINLPLQRHGTASGRLIRDNLNRVEDQRQAALELLEAFAVRGQEEMAKPEAERNKALIQQLLTSIRSLSERVEVLAEYLASEKMLVESMHHLYNGGNP
jgi:hypothetical protein